ncbi:MAG: NFACT RNA binding domain-containing protein [Lactobacillus sp.]|jgi:predicted ribosome quality control (RQC) complex YloA/Tae2 family protein|nr:NFACT RNA binding domain-containing protein [Lactobacillus sp.]MCH3906298.1 NFACT RNA binding domain-containing protein [Lactobacillus sp.]MCH4069159.1 NFACT RNA binding domain-containing protein [Lactobacillus sp.]MCI1303854.1 NFACT RNA binding domain-containing protein [Lactobacillus sp.]MCI1329637.1 NFACT RNA binding domain-containing protein [Lactobacillus sp.]
MAFDGLFIHSLLTAISPTLLNSKLSKIYQPFEHDLIFVFRQQRKNYKLLVSANSQSPRFYFQTEEIPNPDKAPAFVMVLRKYLAGSILKKVEQVGLDRIVNFYFSNRNELGDEVNLMLSFELMGRHSNVILVDQTSGKIIDLLKRINPDENRARLLLPHASYELPPLKPGINPLTLTEEKFKQLANELSPDQLVPQVTGLDRDDRDELLGYLTDDYSFSSWQTFFNQLDHPKVYVLQNERHRERIFLYLPYHLDLTLVSKSEHLNEALEEFYHDQATRDWVRQKSGRIRTVVKNEQKKLRKKIAKLKQQLDAAHNADSLRIKGELLNTYLRQVPAGAKSVDLPNYYDNNQPLTIELDPSLRPERNAQKYFTRYQKLRDSVKHVHEQIKLAEEDLAYFETIQTEIDIADPQDIDAINDELINQGYLHVQKKPQRRKKITTRNLPQFKLTSGKIVLVGKNNYENDWLTFKKANKNDYWFHVKNMPGSHTILQDSNPSPEDIKEAAEIAAYFSKGKNSSHVPVDYIQVKRIKKPHGSKPGFVTYRGQNSIEATPVESNVLAKKIK